MRGGSKYDYARQRCDERISKIGEGTNIYIYIYVLRFADEEKKLDNPEQHLSVTLKKKPTIEQLKVLVDLYDMPYIRLDKNTYESELYTLTSGWVY